MYRGGRSLHRGERSLHRREGSLYRRERSLRRADEEAPRSKRFLYRLGESLNRGGVGSQIGEGSYAKGKVNQISALHMHSILQGTQICASNEGKGPYTHCNVICWQELICTSSWRSASLELLNHAFRHCGKLDLPRKLQALRRNVRSQLDHGLALVLSHSKT
jgi:hypothetical protein